MTAIIILNWNGADDTLACLESLAKAKGDFRAYVVDNGSSDDSVQRIKVWLESHKTFDGCLVPLDKNYGFARGNNKGIAVAREDNPDSYLLLNNDTEVCHDFLVHLKCFSAKNPEYRILTPKINFFSDKQKIWNCGGKLTFGFRKYYYAGDFDSSVQEVGCIPISFVTGCALFFYPELLNDEGELFTERFFFGEEDFELSMRLHAQDIKMACVLDSLIYHKVGATVGKTLGVSKYYMHYLNRFIDVRLHFSPMKYVIWQLLTIPFVVRCFYHSTSSIKLVYRLLKYLLHDAKTKDSVTQEDFNRLVLEHNYFPFDV